jgi:hypothetical protein
MSVLRNKAEQVARLMTDDQGVPRQVAVDPATILALVELIATVVEALIRCYQDNHKKAVARAHNPGILGYAVVRNYAMTCFDGKHARGYTSEASQAVLALGREATVTDMAALFEETSRRNGARAD